MTDFSGKKCLICNKIFSEKDDIVVCPDCGTPYHRECYKQEGKCINTELHASGMSWQQAEEHLNRNAQSHIICPNCGTHNDNDCLFCKSCGIPLNINVYNNTPQNIYSRYNNQGINNTGNSNSNQNQNIYRNISIQPFLINFSDPLCGYNPDEEFDGIKLREIGDFVENNTHYYIPVFKRIKTTGRNLALNFIAMLFPELYFANRKMPLIALAFMLVKILLAVPRYIFSFNELDYGPLSQIAANFNTKSADFELVNTLSIILNYAMMFLSGGFANYFYYKNTIRKIKKIKAKTPPENLSITLRKKGGTSAALLVIFICLMFVPILGLYTYLLF